MAKGYVVATGTYSSHLAKEPMPVFNGNNTFAIAEVVDRPCHEDDVSCDQPRQSVLIKKRLYATYGLSAPKF